MFKHPCRNLPYLTSQAKIKIMKKPDGYEDFKELMGRCELCNKKGVIEHEGNKFCSRTHMDLFDKKMEDAIWRKTLLKNCSICGKPVGKSKWDMIDCRTDIKDPFIPHIFCSKKCWNAWDTPTHV